MAEAAAWQVDYGYMDEVQRGSGVDLAACYQCRKCSNGCPVSLAMDLRPEQVVRLIALGDRKRVESSATIWICASCQTCLTRCPNDVDIPRLMDFLKEKLVERGESGPEPDTRIFHQVFLRDLARRGRIFEGRMMQDYFIKSGQLKPGALIKNAKLGLAMFQKGRLGLVPTGCKGKGEIKKLVDRLGGVK